MIFFKKLHAAVDTAIASISEINTKLNKIEASISRTQSNYNTLFNRVSTIEKGLSELNNECKGKCTSLTTELQSVKDSLETVSKESSTLKADFDRTKRIVVYKRKKEQDKILSNNQ